MQKYDQIIVGAGIGGMTLAALMAMAGRKVLLLEKASRVGGSMLRFTRRGIPFDTGFHFTGGLGANGILSDALKVLGIEESIRPDFIQHPDNNRFVFESTGHDYALPVGHAELIARLKDYFPGETNAIERYFAMVDRVCDQTVSMNLRAIAYKPRMLPESEVTLSQTLQGLTANQELQSILAAYCTCYGTSPQEISFANHSRICHALYRSVARVHGGGQAFTDALYRVLKACDVDIRCSTSLAECADIRDRKVGRFLLSSGEEVSAGECIFTIHPRKILDTLPPEHLHKAFTDRINDLRPSVGFFCLYGVVTNGAGNTGFSPAIISLLPANEMTRFFKPNTAGDRVAVILKHCERIGNISRNVLTALEVSETEDVAEWADSSTGSRQAGYYAYKQERCKRLEQRLLALFPEYAGSLQVLDSASMLTFRDYLHSPWGCAYGVRQKIGQINLFGRLPLRNLYAAGQSAMLPGILGSMLASFIMARTLIGQDNFMRFMEQRLVGSGMGGES